MSSALEKQVRGFTRVHSYDPRSETERYYNGVFVDGSGREVIRSWKHPKKVVGDETSLNHSLYWRYYEMTTVRFTRDINGTPLVSTTMNPNVLGTKAGPPVPGAKPFEKYIRRAVGEWPYADNFNGWYGLTELIPNEDDFCPPESVICKPFHLENLCQRDVIHVFYFIHNSVRVTNLYGTHDVYELGDEEYKDYSPQLLYGMSLYRDLDGTFKPYPIHGEMYYLDGEPCTIIWNDDYVLDTPDGLKKVGYIVPMAPIYTYEEAAYLMWRGIPMVGFEEESPDESTLYFPPRYDYMRWVVGDTLNPVHRAAELMDVNPDLIQDMLNFLPDTLVGYTEEEIKGILTSRYEEVKNFLVNSLYEDLRAKRDGKRSSSAPYHLQKNEEFLSLKRVKPKGEKFDSRLYKQAQWEVSILLGSISQTVIYSLCSKIRRRRRLDERQKLQWKGI